MSDATHRMRTLARQAQTSIDADRLFFARKPGRSHRLRLASRSEGLLHESITDQPGILTPDQRWFVAVHQVSSGARVRVVFAGWAKNAGAVDDVSDADIAAIFDEIRRTSPDLAKVEAALEAMAAGGAA